MASKIEKLKKYLQDLSDRDFYGEITVKFIKGEAPTICKERETIKL